MIHKKDTQSDLTKSAAGIFIISVILIFIYFAKGILTPIIIAFIFALLLLPIVYFLKNKLKFPDVLASLSAIIVALSVLSVLVFVLSSQIANLLNDLPVIQKNLLTNFHQLQEWISQTFNFNLKKQSDIIHKSLESGKLISANSFESLNGITDIIFNIVLIPIYTFLILIYRHNFVKFIQQINKKGRVTKTNEILNQISKVIRQYMLGLFIEMIIVALMTGVGLWIIGAKYFIFLGLLTAILNLIPYIGILIACSISLLMTIVGGTDLSLISGVIIVNVVVQLIDNNILIPKVVGSQVSINAFASMLAVIIGGAIAGVGGMFLAIPVLAILKVIFDHVENLKPYSLLIGEIKRK
ncbi:MAG: AI-2E family transporter [Flavobacteriia bacterium]